MTENFLFQYLEKEDIFIDKNEFLFQIQSHPDYLSLLSIADTLRFFFCFLEILHLIKISRLFTVSSYYCLGFLHSVKYSKRSSLKVRDFMKSLFSIIFV